MLLLLLRKKQSSSFAGSSMSERGLLILRSSVRFRQKLKKLRTQFHIAASPSILATLLICCSARNTAHVGDLYPASSSSSVHFVSFRMIVISACSWPSQHSCFFKKFHPPLVIFHPRPGSRHVVRPSVVMILVSSTRSSHTCDESWILTKPPAGISWSRNQFFPITNGVSCSRSSPGSCADVGIEGASHACFYA